MNKKIFFVAGYLFVFCTTGFSEEGVHVDLSGKAASFEAAHKVFQESCMMCHSSQIPLPWYGRVPGVKQMMKREYREAIEALNLDESVYVTGQAPSPEVLNDIERMVQKGKMPPWSYRLTHPQSRLSNKEKQAIFDWIRDERFHALTPIPMVPQAKPVAAAYSAPQAIEAVSSQTENPPSVRSKQSNPFKPFNP